jgi:hypothetical protein
MTKGRGRKRSRTSRKSTDENVHSQTGQGEEIATPPARCTSPRRGRPEEFIEMNPSKPLQSKEPGIGNDSFYAASAVIPNANHQDKTSSLFIIDCVAKPLLHRFGTNIYVFMLGNWKGIVMKLIIPLLWQQFNFLRKFMT